MAVSYMVLLVPMTDAAVSMLYHWTPTNESEFGSMMVNSQAYGVMVNDWHISTLAAIYKESIHLILPQVCGYVSQTLAKI